MHDLANNSLESSAYVQSQFSFDAGGSRARQIKTRTALTTGAREYEVTDYLGTYEREVHSTAPDSTTTPVTTKTLHRHNLGAIVYTRAITAAGTSVKLTNVLADHLGSTDLLLTATWDQATKTFSIPTGERQAFDPWGERANPTTAQPYRQSDADPFRRSSTDYDRGYTGHEQLDDSGLIHMNGRLYDPELGRMLSPDPYVQVPEYSQNFNRYSYVLNNPLNKTDPTGYSWLSKAFHKIGSWFSENWRTVVSIAFTVALTFLLMPGLAFAGIQSLGWMAGYGNMAIGATIGGISGAANAALAGGNIGDVLRGAAVGAIQGAISSGPLHNLEAGAQGLSMGTAMHVVGHGAVGGAANVAMGGKFQDGFVSAASSAFVGDMGWNEGATPVSRTIKAGIIGGTVSALGGGKFANGAYTAAFQHLLNKELITQKKVLWATTENELLSKQKSHAAFNEILENLGDNKNSLEFLLFKNWDELYAKLNSGTYTDLILDVHGSGFSAGTYNIMYDRNSGGQIPISNFSAKIPKNLTVYFSTCSCAYSPNPIYKGLAGYKESNFTAVISRNVNLKIIQKQILRIFAVQNFDSFKTKYDFLTVGEKWNSQIK